LTLPFGDEHIDDLRSEVCEGEFRMAHELQRSKCVEPSQGGIEERSAALVFTSISFGRLQ